ncbi:MAG: imidazoleglycerol-phosphate dehydratase HisB [Dehalococcoidia bacterium]
MERTATVIRETGETSVSVEFNIDGTGQHQIETGLVMLDHMLAQLARHGVFDLRVKATARMDPDGHHTVEDVAIAIGQALNQALGEKQGIARMAHAYVPLDEALAFVAVDFSGRGYPVIDATFQNRAVGDLLTDLVRHFFETLAREARINLHAQVVRGINDHHKIECLFKALARALDAATQIDRRIEGGVPSTKGVIEG